MEQIISTYITELLYKNECVIIPQFGGFVARHISARVSDDGSMISPPSRSVLFNRNLINNDGLLVNFIMEKSDLSYEAASEECRNFANYCERSLTDDHRLELNGIGLFFLDQEKNIQFEPKTDVNYLIEAYGLQPLSIQPIEQKTTEPIIALKDRKTIPAEKTNRQKYLRIAAAAIAIPIIAAGTFFSFSNKKTRNSLASFFGAGAQSVYIPSAYKNNYSQYVAVPPGEIITDANGYAGIKLGNNESNYIFINVSDTISTDKTFVKKSFASFSKKNAGKGKYKIVVGCFSVEENAIRLINTLHERNINASLAGLNKNGLHIVSAGASDNADEARNLLKQVRQNYPSAWLMHE